MKDLMVSGVSLGLYSARMQPLTGQSCCSQWYSFLVALLYSEAPETLHYCRVGFEGISIFTYMDQVHVFRRSFAWIGYYWLSFLIFRGEKKEGFLSQQTKK